MEIAKAGSMLRLSSVLKNWKPCWFVLFINGELHFWETEDAYRRGERSQGKVLIRDEVKKIVGGRACNADAPDTRTKDSLLGLKRKGGDQTVYLCAESSDDMSAWVFMLDQARTIEGGSTNNPAPQTQHFAPPPSYVASNTYMVQSPAGGYVQPVPGVSYGAHGVPPYPVQPAGATYTYYPPGYNYVQPGTTYVYGQPNTTIVVRDDCYGYGHCHDSNLAGGMAVGMATGAMLGATMMMPFWFF